MTRFSRFGACVALCSAPFLLAPGCGGSTEPGGVGGTGGQSFHQCSNSSECVIVPESCCGQCGAATREDIAAVNVSMLSAFREHACPNGQACPACYMEQDPALIATCASATCTPVDLLKHASTECATNGDCRIRTTSCCECGGATDPAHIVAISEESSFSSLVCDGQACPECAPIYPADALAVCDLGRCKAIWKNQ